MDGRDPDYWRQVRSTGYVVMAAGAGVAVLGWPTGNEWIVLGGVGIVLTGFSATAFAEGRMQHSTRADYRTGPDGIPEVTLPCPVCRTPNDVGHRFCAKCGQRL